MRIALLAITDLSGSGHMAPKAHLRVAGASVVQHQLGTARALSCSKVICLATSPSAALTQLRHAAQEMGIHFATAATSQQIAGLISAQDDLIVISEGLFVEPDVAKVALEGEGHAVWVQPVEGALTAGFERIDVHRASAGILCIPANLVEKLHEMPDDCDVISTLTRLALQAGIEPKEIPQNARSATSWQMVRNEAEAYALESEWLRARWSESPAHSPGRSVVRFGVQNFGSTLLHSGKASHWASIAVLSVVGVSLVIGWFGLTWLGFIGVGLAWLLTESQRVLRRTERYASGMSMPAIPRADVLEWLTDSAMIALMLMTIPRYLQQPWLIWLSAPLMMMGVITLFSRIVTGRVADWVSDRALWALLFSGACLIGQLPSLLSAASLALLLGSFLCIPRGTA